MVTEFANDAYRESVSTESTTIRKRNLQETNDNYRPNSRPDERSNVHFALLVGDRKLTTKYMQKQNGKNLGY